MPKFTYGDRVKLTSAVPGVPVGALGTVIDVFELSVSYDVTFDSGATRRVVESSLAFASGAVAAAKVIASGGSGDGGGDGGGDVVEYTPKGLLAECIAALREFRTEVIRSQQTESRFAMTSGFAVRCAFSAFATPSSNVHATGVGLRRQRGRIDPKQAVLKLFVFDKLSKPEMAGIATAAKWRGLPVDIEHLPIQVVRSAKLAGKKKPVKAQGLPPQRAHIRPIVGGISISPLNAAYVGTLGCFLRRRRVDSEAVFALSNNHVLANVDSYLPGTLIVQPGPEKPPYLTSPNDAFAALHSAIPISFPNGRTPLVVNRFDAAIATVNDVGLITTASMFGIKNYNPARVVTPYPGMRVTKSGRTSGVTQGVVTAIRVDGVQVNYGTQQAPRIAVFDDTVEIEGDNANGGPFSMPGDSGSVILESSSGYPVALLFAGDGVHTTASELGSLCRRLRAWPA